MNQLEYRPGAAGLEAVQMDAGDAFVGAAEGLRSYEWAYEAGYRSVESATRPAYEADVDFAADFATLDALRRVSDADLAARTPGTFVAEGEWSQRGYIVASKTQEVGFGSVIKQLRVLLLDGAWWRLVVHSFYADSGTATGGFLDYPYDYEYDYMAPTSETSVTPSVLTPSAVRIVIYGPAVNPYVMVGANKYQVLVTVPAGGYLTVDGREKTIVLTLADGTEQNAFAYGLRGTGQGGGQYIFEPIKGGEQDVSWNGTFGFDLGWYEEEGEPPWSR